MGNYTELKFKAVLKEDTPTEVIELLNRVINEKNLGHDKQRLENLKNMCELVSELVVQIDSVNLDFYQSPAQSERTASEYVLNFLTKELGIV